MVLLCICWPETILRTKTLQKLTVKQIFYDGLVFPNVNQIELEKKVTFLVQAGTFLCFQAKRFSAGPRVLQGPIVLNLYTDAYTHKRSCITNFKRVSAGIWLLKYV